MKIVFFIFYLLLILINFDLPPVNISNLKENKIYKCLYKYSYYGILMPIHSYNYEYTFSKYLLHIIIFSASSAMIYYATISNLYYSILIFVIISLVIPYLYLIKCKKNYYLFIEQNCFDYATNIVIFLKDNLVISDLLLSTCNNIENPMKSEIIKLIKFVNNTNNFNEGLAVIEKKYQYSFIKNVNILLKNVYEKGSNNQELYDYIFDSIEYYQLQLNKYRSKKDANKKIFYLIVYLDLFGVLMLMKMFTTSSFSITNLNNFSTIIFLFYLLNILSIIFYENYCYRTIAIEKGVIND